MRDNVLWRKIARIVLLIAKEYNISEEQALEQFYHSRVYEMLKDPRYGFQLMSDGYILEEYVSEIQTSRQN